MKPLLRSLGCLLLGLLCGAGCQREPAVSTGELKLWSSNIEARVRSLEAVKLTNNAVISAADSFEELAADYKFTMLSNRLHWAEGRLTTLEGDSLHWNDVDVTKPNYGVFQTKIGRLLISVKDTVPYLDGYRVALDVGNPTSADLTSVKLHIRTSVEFNFTNLVAYNASIENRIEDINVPLKAGRWTPVTFTLSPATPERLRNLSLAIETSQVYLLKSP